MKRLPPNPDLNLTPPLLIAIAGGSGAGKTWLSERIAAAFPGQVTRVSLDDFYRDRSHLSPSRRKRINYDHPRAIDWPLLLKFLQDYRHGTHPVFPRYDFTTHCRQKQSVVCDWRPILVVEGLWSLARRALREMFDARIYVECPQHLRLQRRIARDAAERGRSAREVRAQFRHSVLPMHSIHVAPQKRWATTVLAHPISEAQVEQLIAQLPTHQWREAA
jgi:uridine kinase